MSDTAPGEAHSGIENPFTEEVSEFAKELLEEWKLPGMSAAFVTEDQVFTAAYGYATLPDTPATPETLWFGASVTKAFTAALLAQLIEDKEYAPRLPQGWETPISSIIPLDFVLEDEWATKNLTLEDAVCHRTGYSRHDLACASEVDGKVQWPGDIVRNLRNLPGMSAPPRTKFLYSNTMYIVLSHVIEVLTGKTLGEVMKERIWEPLGMGSTYLYLSDAEKGPEHLATGYYWDPEAKAYRDTPPTTGTEISGAGAIISNAVDFAKWVQCMLTEGKPFSPAVHKDIRKSRILGGMPTAPFDVDLYGLGWQRTSYRGHPVYRHGGGLFAFGSDVIWFPERKIGFVAFGNVANLGAGAVAEMLAFKAFDDVLRIAKEDRFDFATRWRGFSGMLQSIQEKAVETVYPDRSEQPLPSMLSIEKLAGTYYDPGYKGFTLRVQPHPKESEKQILMGERKDMAWRYTTELHHITGNYWIMYMCDMYNPCSLLRQFASAEFRIGADGEVASLDVHFVNRIGEPVDEGIVAFKKVA